VDSILQGLDSATGQSEAEAGRLDGDGKMILARLDGWIQAASLELTAADLEEFAAALERTNAGAGPTHPKERKPATKGHSA